MQCWWARVGVVLCISTGSNNLLQGLNAVQASTSSEAGASEAQGPNMQRFVQQLSGKVCKSPWHLLVCLASLTINDVVRQAGYLLGKYTTL